jgi:hypothetical protein
MFGSRQIAIAQRKIDLKTLGIEYVLKRDEILKNYGLDPLLGVPQYDRIQNEILKNYGPDPLLGVPQYDRIQNERHYEEEQVTKLKELLELKSIPEIIDLLIQNFDKNDDLPVIHEFIEQDIGNKNLKNLENEYNREYGEFVFSFLKKHSKDISKEALIGYVGAGISKLTFGAIFKSL